MKRNHLAALILLSAFSTSALADFLDDERQKNLQLSRAEPSAEVLYQRASLANGKTAEHTFRLEAGQQYGLYADCDEAQQCNNLDFQFLYQGKVIDQDMGKDTFPLLIVTAEHSGDYTIRTIMSECAASSCDYHVQVINEEPKTQASNNAGSLSDASLPAREFLAAERKTNLNILNTVTGDKNNVASEIFYRTGSLASGKSADYRVALKANQTYCVYVDCAPSSCNDIDMEILLNGKVVQKDELPDTYPLLHITPERNATYTIRAKMEECKTGNASCDYHVQVIKRE